MTSLKHTSAPWVFRPAVYSNDVGAWGLPSVKQRAAIIIPEHFDDEANDDIDCVEVRLEANAEFIVRAVNLHEELVACLMACASFQAANILENTSINKQEAAKRWVAIKRKVRKALAKVKGEPA